VNRLKGILFLILTLCTAGTVFGQAKTIIGNAKDQHSAEPVPFASVRFRVSGNGVLADSSGGFSINVPVNINDTLEITSVGYQDFYLPINSSLIAGDTLRISANLVPGKFTTTVTLKVKVNRGLILWRRIVAHKPMNDRYRFRNFS
jgi:hypothetical protein